MQVAREIIFSAALLAMASAFFGVVVARIIWANEATRAAEMTAGYKKIHQTDQETFATMKQTIDTLQETIDLRKQR